MYKNKKVYFFLLIIIMLSLSLSSEVLNDQGLKKIYIIYSDSIQADSEIVSLDKNLNTRSNIQIPARDIVTSCNEKGTVLLPTSSDNKLFKIDKSETVKSSETDLGGDYIKYKNNEQLTLYNVSLEYNRINFICSDSQIKSLDIKDSLLLSADFDDKNIYVLGYKFDKNKEGDTFLFIIDKSEFKIKDEIKLMKNMRVYDTSLIDDKLFIGVDRKVDFLLYYDVKRSTLNKIEYKDYLKEGTMDTKKILYSDKYIFYISLDGNILQLNKASLDIVRNIKLNNKVILSACLDKDKLYSLSVDINKNNQIGLVDVFDCDNLDNINNLSVGPIRNTTPRDILILE
ncbi:hypothetical protein CBE01nite_20850 [Clostridium beijerinckii]|uniref:Uncharacterized protein n=1 Tax=Clostridium beijerinckii TaxID=1520 RepID=A0AB74VGI7_CLOBE|nr:hypothetical protein [Clostridium beijerinckii]NRZ24769.1 hypothetical protein [Clostridium beijerinckii]NYB99017.1 hypothetical protein [Clostridium beijerinckii]OOM19812.1 hypothetical protein CLBEI_48130 [Clostridium beijerinckii]QUN35576.1 hypothetical protein KEC93_01615 [Clostridium beijerinckii]SQB22065.1 Uncharacterised protein [Clostridium beijerinckii]